MMYLAIDGDDVGNLIETPILLNDLVALRAISNDVVDAVQRIATGLEERGVQVLMAAGDSVVAVVDSEQAGDLSDLLNPLGTRVRFSAGVGDTLRLAWVALKYAKTRKPSVVYFDGEYFTTLWQGESPGGRRDN